MARRPRTDFSCLDCGKDTGKIYEYYMLEDSVWYCIMDTERGMLCVGCCEKRLGRQLVPEDFYDCYLNKCHQVYPKSARLLSRITGVNPNE